MQQITILYKRGCDFSFALACNKYIKWIRYLHVKQIDYYNIKFKDAKVFTRLYVKTPSLSGS